MIDEAGRVVKTLVDEVKQRVTMPPGRGRRLVSGEPLAASLLRADWLYWPSLAFRREALQSTDFRDGFPIIQDLALVVDLVAAGRSLLIEPEVCFSYRRHTASASSAKLLDGSRFVGSGTTSGSRPSRWRSAAGPAPPAPRGATSPRARTP